jgi:hypothetical protein
MMNRLIIAFIVLYPASLLAFQSSDEDHRALAEAIDARNLEAPEKYAPRDEVSLFEKITNAYIRNYEKVLTGKKEHGPIKKSI